MVKIIRKIKSASVKSLNVIKTDGPVGFTKRGAKYAYYKRFPEKRKIHSRDILFINGCELPHPTRYRVDHQIEQLRSHGLTADSVFYNDLNVEMLKYYRGFVFFRCPVTETVRDFISKAKEDNKACFFDIDDLVIDQKYTDQIEYVSTMAPADKHLYDDGVNRMRETLSMCDYAITTTERLSGELSNYTKEVFINRNVASDEMVGRSTAALKGVRKDESKVVIGYFSGSITHNEDFNLILPAITKLLEKHKNAYLKIVGLLDIPDDLLPFEDRIIGIDFMDWRGMQTELALCDINIAPLTRSVFNEAKSENKWTEASLVKVVTVASDIGAFKKAIRHNETGLLTSDTDWFETLDDLIMNPEKRVIIGSAAQKDVLSSHTTITTGYSLANYISSKLARNIAFLLPSTDISGGVNVVLKHADILKRNGWDVTLVDAIQETSLKAAQKQYGYRLTIPGHNVLTSYRTTQEARFDTVVATLWSTLKNVNEQPNVLNRLYFVQNLETDFYEPGTTDMRIAANATYNNLDVRYITMSLWCQKWLTERFDKPSRYSSNGIDLHDYPIKPRSFDRRKIKILIEGDSSSEYKNTDEAFRVVNELNPDIYEISYLSYRKEPKQWYRVDNFYNRIPPKKVGEIYANCDILLKTSLLESFSYPPLEMMATGGVSVVLPNDGNKEYLKDGYNCLFYEQGNIPDAIEKISSIVENEKLRSTLITNGLKTAKKYSWENMENQVLSLYE